MTEIEWTPEKMVEYLSRFERTFSMSDMAIRKYLAKEVRGPGWNPTKDACNTVTHPCKIPVSNIPTTDNVRALVIGAGATWNLDRALDFDYSVYDIILITLPMAKSYEFILEEPGAYVVDAELDWNIVPWFYPGITEKMRAVFPHDKRLETTWKFKDLYVYHNEGWPRSSGAVALHLACEIMRAERVDAVGIDLTKRYVMFKEETMHYLEREGVFRL